MIRVHLLPETPATGPAWSCAEIRLLRPYGHASLRHSFKVTSSGGQVPDRVDIVVAQRAGPPHFGLQEIVDLVHTVRSRRAKLIYDLDDDLLSPHPVPDVDRLLEPARPKIRYLLREADLVTTSTKTLASRLQPINPRIQVWRTALDESLVPPLELDRTGAELGYFGTYSHLPDLMSILESLEAAAPTAPDIRFDLCGITQDPRLAFIGRARFRTRVLPVQGDYSRFHRMLAQEARWRVGLAPLSPSKFNDSKSDIKALDYAATGIAAVVSDSPVYDWHLDGSTVLRQPHVAFGVAAFRLLQDDDLRRHIARAAYERLLAERVLAVASPALADHVASLRDGGDTA